MITKMKWLIWHHIALSGGIFLFLVGCRMAPLHSELGKSELESLLGELLREGLGLWFSDKVLAARGPGFNPQHDKKEKKKISGETNKKGLC